MRRLLPARVSFGWLSLRWFNNLSLQARLLAGFGLILGLTALVAFVGVTSLQSGASRAHALYSQNTMGVHWANQVAVHTIAGAKDEQNALLELSNDPTRTAFPLKHGRDELALAKTAAAEYRKTITKSEESNRWKAVEDTMAQVATEREAIFALVEQGKAKEAADASRIAASRLDALNSQLTSIISRNQEAATAAAADSDAAAARARTILLGATAVAVLLGVAIALVVSIKLRRDVRQLVARIRSVESEAVAELEAGIRAVEQGDLTVEVQARTALIPRPSRDEIGQASSAINRTVEKLTGTIASYNSMRLGLAGLVGQVRGDASAVFAASGDLQEASDAMASASSQIASSITEVTKAATTLSALSQQSAEDVERVAAGSQELAAVADSNASSASTSEEEARAIGARIGEVVLASEQVAQSADASRRAAQEGQKAVGQAVASMQAIAGAVERASGTVNQLGEYSQQIGTIVKAIDDIARQTNLLALNAAIEAARAGEQGRGFAVVADNVRGLAERSSHATKEIAALIAKVQSGTREAVEAMAAGVQDVEAGRRITTQAGAALESIIESVQVSAVEMEKITAEIQSLASGADRIVDSARGIAESARDSANGAKTMAGDTSRVTEAILQVSVTSEQTSASAEEVSASTQELTAQSEELAATATQMRGLAESLERSTSRFRIEGLQLASAIVAAAQPVPSAEAAVESPAEPVVEYATTVVEAAAEPVVEYAATVVQSPAEPVVEYAATVVESPAEPVQESPAWSASSLDGWAPGNPAVVAELESQLSSMTVEEQLAALGFTGGPSHDHAPHEVTADLEEQLAAIADSEPIAIPGLAARVDAEADIVPDPDPTPAPERSGKRRWRKGHSEAA
ncbi:MAG TPA: methyl-accepting chemotaxis protein [Tepidiformaceae bacterium]|nr:methyl-accepting chemotaxis protein [Tepidiformaceae bacterium]